MNRHDPARDVTPAFLARVADWLAASGELLIILRYLHAAGAKDFALCRSLAQFHEIVHAAPIGTDIEVVRTPPHSLIEGSWTIRSWRS